MIRAVVALFGAGVASFLAPCVLPLVPAYVGMMAGASASTAGASERGSARHRLPSALSFVGGFTAVFVAFGLAAGSLGASFDRARGVVQLVGGGLVIVFGLALLGLARGPLARTLRVRTSWPRPVGRTPVASPVSSAVMGVTFGAAWTPCVGPLLGVALVTATRSGSAGRGGLLLAAYAAGLGVPFVVAALALDAFPTSARALLRAGRRPGAALQRAAGACLVVLGALVVTGRYSTLVSALARWRR